MLANYHHRDKLHGLDYTSFECLVLTEPSYVDVYRYSCVRASLTWTRRVVVSA